MNKVHFLGAKRRFRYWHKNELRECRFEDWADENGEIFSVWEVEIVARRNSSNPGAIPARHVGAS